jgi:hypothetical protein
VHATVPVFATSDPALSDPDNICVEEGIDPPSVIPTHLEFSVADDVKVTVSLVP